MVWSGWRAGTAGVAVGLTTWLVAPWVSMAVRGTADDRHATWLRGQTGRGAGRGGAPGRPDPATGMPRAWDTIPGPRPRERGRSGAASS